MSLTISVNFALVELLQRFATSRPIGYIACTTGCLPSAATIISIQYPQSKSNLYDAVAS
jgi:hypothetical protein